MNRNNMRRFTSFAAIILLSSLLSHATVSSQQNGVGSVPLVSRLSTAKEFLAAHNKIRISHNVKPLVWDRKLARYARRWANTARNYCPQLIHSPSTPYGENSFWCLKGHWNATTVVKDWGDEMQYYDAETNECINNSVCGHYTQIVWNSTQSVGCVHVTCANSPGFLFVCSYNPPGNIYYHGPFGGQFNKSVVYPPNNAPNPTATSLRSKLNRVNSDDTRSSRGSFDKDLMSGLDSDNTRSSQGSVDKNIMSGVTGHPPSAQGLNRQIYN